MMNFDSIPPSPPSRIDKVPTKIKCPFASKIPIISTQDKSYYKFYWSSSIKDKFEF